MAWLGLNPDRVEHQSARLPRYDAAVERLKASGRLYPAYESEEELETRRLSRRRRGLPPLYDRAALKLTDADRAALEAQGRRPHWRFRLDGRAVAWEDMVRGHQTVDTATLSDPVLVREDGSYLYTLTSVVDDIEMGVTHVVRGEDHVTNTGVQIEIIEALGGTAPTFAHHNLLTLPSGEGLSKRLGHLSLKALREEGEEALAVASLAVLTGTSMAVEPVDSLDALAAKIDFSKISRAPARFDPGRAFGAHRRDAASSAPCGGGGAVIRARRRGRRGVLARRAWQSRAAARTPPCGGAWWRGRSSRSSRRRMPTSSPPPLICFPQNGARTSIRAGSPS